MENTPLVVQEPNWNNDLATIQKKLKSGDLKLIEKEKVKSAIRNT